VLEQQALFFGKAKVSEIG